MEIQIKLKTWLEITKIADELGISTNEVINFLLTEDKQQKAA